MRKQIVRYRIIKLFFGFIIIHNKKPENPILLLKNWNYLWHISSGKNSRKLIVVIHPLPEFDNPWTLAWFSGKFFCDCNNIFHQSSFLPFVEVCIYILFFWYCCWSLVWNHLCLKQREMFSSKGFLLIRVFTMKCLLVFIESRCYRYPSLTWAGTSENIYLLCSEEKERTWKILPDHNWLSFHVQ